MGALTAAAWLPWLVIGLPAGAWVDRLPPRRVMITSDLVAAAALASVPVAWATDTLTLAELVGVALANGTCAVFFRTAYGKLIPDIVEAHHLEQANGRMFGTQSAMQVIGPGAGGLISFPHGEFRPGARCLLVISSRHCACGASAGYGVDTT